MPVAAGLAETRQGSIATCLSAAEAGRYLLAIDVAPTPGGAAISYPAKLLRAVLDILLAKPSGASAAPESRITEIETHILKNFFDAFTGTLRKAWAPTEALFKCPANGKEQFTGDMAAGATRYCFRIHSINP